jgi:hypothetical protein
VISSRAARHPGKKPEAIEKSTTDKTARATAISGKRNGTLHPVA